MSLGATLTNNVPGNRRLVISQRTRQLVDMITQLLVAESPDIIDFHVLLKVTDTPIDKDLIDRDKLYAWTTQEDLAIAFKSDAYYVTPGNEVVAIFWGPNKELIRDAWLEQWQDRKTNESNRQERRL